MTPEEKFNQEIWWILQEIRKEQLSTPKGEKVEFTLRKPPKYSRKTDDNLPSAEAQRKLLHKLKEWKALDLESIGLFADDNIFTPPTAYLLTIHQSKFDDFYRLYESGGSYSESKNAAPEPKTSQSIIKPKSLEVIAKEIGNMETGTNLIDFLTDCGVDKKLIAYPQTKWRMVYDVFIALATSSNPKNQEILFKVIEEASHPLMHNGDEQVAKTCEDKFNSLLKYDNFVIKKGKLKKIDQEPELDKDEEDDDEEDVFSYDGGISSAYENTDLELFILKKIQLEHKRRDDSGFSAKELSFNGNSLEEICRVINKLMEDKILYLSTNTRPERTEKEEGIKDKDGFINWKMVEKLDKNKQEMDTENGCVIFDTEILDEVKLKGRIDIAIEEFMNDKVYNPLGMLMDKAEVNKILASVENETNKNKKTAVPEALKSKDISHPYYKQRAIIIDEISRDNKEELEIPLIGFSDRQVDVLKTLLALEKENLLRITELRSNPVYDDKGNFLGKWSEKDNPVAKIYTLKTQANKQEPMLLKIVEMPELQVKELTELVKNKVAENKPKFPHKLPAGTKWEEITIKFVDDENVYIQVKQLKHTASYKELGLVGRGKNPNPSELWAFLKVLAQVNGELAIKDAQAKNKYKKQKELLAKALQNYFSLDYDPFYPYHSSTEKSGNSYKIKITLIPPPDKKEKANANKNNDNLEIKKEYKRQTPEIYDKYQ
jgi:hypothetical protein